MAYVNKLDTNILTITVDTTTGTRVYVSTSGTIELDDVIAYFTNVQLDGTITAYTSLILGGSSIPIIVDETYATIDGLINP